MPSTSVSHVNRVREEILEPLRRTLSWFAALRDHDGRIVCPVHKIEHTGKSAYAIVSACELLELDPSRDSDFLRGLAIGQAKRLLANLKREGDSPCHTFRPGWHDPFNCSNSVIDGGACSDALAHLVRALGPSLAADDRESFAAASLLHARTYLRYAVLDKGIPAQRAWGLTGLAGAWSLENDPVLEQAAIEAVGVLEGIQHADGSYPYHPVEWGAEHAGASDVSSFYQSRIPGFLAHSLRLLGRDPADALFRGPIERGLEFTLALQAPDGTKCGLVEAKPWYWGANHEVASHPFDVHAFTQGWRLFGRAAYADAAVRAFRAWAARLKPDGEPRSHLDGPGRERSYQCPLFWSSHAAWILRAARDLEAAMVLGTTASGAASGSVGTRDPTATGATSGPVGARDPIALEPTGRRAAARGPTERDRGLGGSIDLSVRWFGDASLGRLEDGRVIAWVRGRRPAVNVHHGSPHGAGLLRVFDKRAGKDVLERCRLSGTSEGEWNGAAGSIAPLRGWRANARELRFSIWLARVHLRAGRYGEALLAPARVFRRGVLAFAHPRVSSAFDLAPEVEVRDGEIVVRSSLAHRDGSRAKGSALVRRFSVDGDGLVVEEELANAGAARGVEFFFPRAARDTVREGNRATYRIP